MSGRVEKRMCGEMSELVSKLVSWYQDISGGVRGSEVIALQRTSEDFRRVS